jgi:HK97 family phage prohead protease
VIDREFRSFPAEISANPAESGPTIEGYAAVWGALTSVPIRHPKRGLFLERVARGAFAAELATRDVGCYVDHDSAKPLGRTSAGTLSVWEDDRGLAFRCQPPATSYANDLMVSIARRDVPGCSVGMYVFEDSWSRDFDGTLIRTVTRAGLFDVSPTSQPAVTATDVALRSLDAFLRTEEERAEIDAYLRYAEARLRVAGTR